MIKIIGDTIYHHGRAVATVTMPEGANRDAFERRIDGREEDDLRQRLAELEAELAIYDNQA